MLLQKLIESIPCITFPLTTPIHPKIKNLNNSLTEVIHHLIVITYSIIIGVSTRQVRTSGDRDDPGGYRRLAAIEGWVYTRPVKRKSMTFYFVYLLITISVLDISKCL